MKPKGHGARQARRLTGRGRSGAGTAAPERKGGVAAGPGFPCGRTRAAPDGPCAGTRLTGPVRIQVAEQGDLGAAVDRLPADVQYQADHGRVTERPLGGSARRRKPAGVKPAGVKAPHATDPGRVGGVELAERLSGGARVAVRLVVRRRTAEMRGGPHAEHADDDVREPPRDGRHRGGRRLREDEIRRVAARARRAGGGGRAGPQGIRQFIDIGSGLPTVGNTHQVVQKVYADARAVYVDSDPIVLAHATELLAGNPAATLIQADLRDPGAILGNRELRELIDVAEPTGLLVTTVMNFVTDSSDPWGLVKGYVSALAPGSYLALSHWTDDKVPPLGAQRAGEVYSRGTQRIHFRSKADIERFFEGLEMRAWRSCRPTREPSRPSCTSACGGPRTPSLRAARAPGGATAPSPAVRERACRGNPPGAGPHSTRPPVRRWVRPRAARQVTAPGRYDPRAPAGRGRPAVRRGRGPGRTAPAGRPVTPAAPCRRPRGAWG